MGCGAVGSGIVQFSAQLGFAVNVMDMDKEELDKGTVFINSMVSGKVKEGKLTQEDNIATIERSSGSTDYKNFSE